MAINENELLDSKVYRLEQCLRQYSALGVAFSGGVDSTLLLAAAKRIYGHRVYAFTAQSIVYPPQETQLAVKLAKQLDVQLVLFDFNALEEPEFVANRPDRCYHCKKRLLKNMSAKAARFAIDVLAHGANIDDLADYRPGQKATEEMGIAAPLIEAQLTKADIRALAKKWGLPNWNRPAMPCLATRIPYGICIDAQLLHRIQAAEQIIQQLGVAHCRVRHHGDVARIEVNPENIQKLVQPQIRSKIVTALHDLGYSHVSIDLEGYRSGKMNRSLFE
jgi:uncharacterized protein